jgi:hypothetical protein
MVIGERRIRVTTEMPKTENKQTKLNRYTVICVCGHRISIHTHFSLLTLSHTLSDRQTNRDRQKQQKESTESVIFKTPLTGVR